MKAEIKTRKGDIFPMGTRRAAGHAMGREYVNIIKQRTLRGVYGSKSRPYGRRVNSRGRALGTVKNYNEDYAERKGYPLSPVTMGGASGRILKSMRHGLKFDKDFIILGIIFDDSSVQKIVNYNDTMGAGKSRIIRNFIYANQRERRRIVAAGKATLTR